MDKIFSPALTVLNRMNYTKRFSLLWLLSLIAIVIVAYALIVSLERVIQPSQRELEGMVFIKPLSQTVQLIQQHRGISAALLSGNRTLRERRPAKEAEVVEALRILEHKLPANLASNDRLRQIKAGWEQLRNNGLNLDMRANFTAHTDLIEQLQSFKVFIADEYLLTIDPEIATYYLLDTTISTLPDYLECFGRVRAYGTGILTRKQISASQQVELRVMIAELGNALKSLNTQLDKVGRHNPTVQKSMLKVSDDIATSSQQIIDHVTTDFFTGYLATTPEVFLEMTTSVIDRSYEQMHDSLLPTAEFQVKARIARAKKTMYTNIGIAGLLLLLVIYMSVSIYYAIIGNIQSLVRSARAFAGGDLCVRAKLDTHDELKWVGDSFNEMADGFNTMLEAQKKAERSLQDSHERLYRLLNSMVEGVYGVDTGGDCTFINRAAMQLLGYQKDDEIVGRNMHELIHHSRADGSSYPENECGIYRTLKTNQTVSVSDEVFWRQDGIAIPVEYRSHPVLTEGVMTGAIVTFSDITERKKAEQDIHQLAFYDPLTGLPNRRLLIDRLQQALAASTRSGNHGAVMFIDLDNFKIINDTKGHDYGDLLLVEAARRLQSCVREGDTVARLGGDEFLVILEDLKGEKELAATLADEVGRKILASLDHTYLFHGYEFKCTASIGINLFSGHEAGTDDLLKCADIAMYQAKTAGHNTVRFFDLQMQVILETQAALAADLHRALELSEFELHYQPKVNLRTGGISSGEALLRWRHPQRGLVSPTEFIPSLEESGLIVPVGAWVLRTACLQARAWQVMGVEACGVAVNLSAVQFHGQDICELVLQTLKKTGLEARFLELEITESTIMKDVDSATQTLRALKSLGVRLSVDDFGTGHSSLSYLKRFAPDILKVDQSFVRDITTDPDDALITCAIIGLAHNLGMKVIAEGVETEAQRSFLGRNGCDEMQGYYYSKPLPVDAYTGLLNENRLLDQTAINSGRVLLLVDDEEFILSSLKRLLRRDGYQILTAASARQGFELLAMHPVGVIVSDQRMPDMSGTEFLSKVKEIYPHTVRMVLSGYTDLQSVTEAINHGSIYKFLTKPCDDNLLRETIQNAFDRFESVANKDRAEDAEA